MLPIINESQTISMLLQGHSIARFGDGELRIALGNSVGHQAHHPKLQEELLHILKNPTKCLVGVPYVDIESPKREVWENYSAPKYQALYNQEKQYYSSFITRPDSAPWIDCPAYWETIKHLWKDKHVTVVSGSKKGFQLGELPEAKGACFIQTLSEQAYDEIDNIERSIIAENLKTVILSCGITATVLAWRLAEKGFQALDLGHLPMFMRRKGLL